MFQMPLTLIGSPTFEDLKLEAERVFVYEN